MLLNSSWNRLDTILSKNIFFIIIRNNFVLQLNFLNLFLVHRKNKLLLLLLEYIIGFIH